MKRFIFEFWPRIVIVALLFLLAAVSSFAGTGTAAFAWTRPTTYTDGSALPASAISRYDVLCTFTPTGGTASACTLNPSTFAGTASSGSLALTYPATGGRACFRLTVSTATGVSDPSNEACVDFAAAKPSAPANLTVTITIAVNP